MEFLDNLLRETDMTNQSIEHQSNVGDDQKNETAESTWGEEYLLPSFHASNLLDDSGIAYNNFLDCFPRKEITQLPTSTVDHTSTTLSSLDVCPNMVECGTGNFSHQQENVEPLSDLLSFYSEDNSLNPYSGAEKAIHSSSTNVLAVSHFNLEPVFANGVNIEAAVTKHTHSTTPIVADLALATPSAHCSELKKSNYFNYGDCLTPSPARQTTPDLAAPISTPCALSDLETTPTTFTSRPVLQSTDCGAQGTAPLPITCSDLGIQLPTHNTATTHPDNSEGLKGHLPSTHYVSEYLGDSEENGTNLNYKGQSLGINTNTSFGQSSLVENPQNLPTPSLHNTFSHSEPSSLPLNQVYTDDASKANFYVDQLDSCFDSLLSPAPAPGPGQGCFQDNNNNSDEVIQTEKQTIKAGPALPVSIRMSHLENIGLELDSLISYCDMTSASSGVDKMDKTGFKTDLSNFFSNMALAVPLAVQSGQNIIPPMENSKRSKFFWTVDKFGEDEDEEIFRPDMIEVGRVINYGPSNEDHRMLNPSFEGGDVVEIGNELPKHNMNRGWNGENNVLQSQNMKDWKVRNQQLEKLSKAKKSGRRCSVRKNSKRVRDVLPIVVKIAEKDPKVSGVVKNIRIKSPVAPSFNQKIPNPHHSIQNYQRRQINELTSAKSTGETNIVNSASNEAIDNKYDDHNQADAKCTSSVFSTPNESTVGKNMHDKEVGLRVHSSSRKTLVYQICWRCKSSESPGSWHAHKWQKNKFLCSTCFNFFKQKKKEKRSGTQEKTREVNRMSEISTKQKTSYLHEKVVGVVEVPEFDEESNKVPSSYSSSAVGGSSGSISYCPE